MPVDNWNRNLADLAGIANFDSSPTIFANLLLADEMYRATPKTQSAMLEAIRAFSHGS
jgi:MoxR-like ATPase